MNSSKNSGWTTGIAVVIPCFLVKDQIIKVVEGIGPEVDRIYVVDDSCPRNSGQFVESEVSDERVRVLFNDFNEGVGGATLRGMHAAFDDGALVVVKMDGDGQMDAAMIPRLVSPLLKGAADYTKGNRFYDLSGIGQMPRRRIFGNVVLSFLSKLSSGYWDIFDPTNGYVAVHRDIFTRLPLDKISKRYFFESDILFWLNISRAVVIDIPMPAIYGGAGSSLKIPRIILPFLFGHMRNTFSRIFYSYYLRDFSIASLYLVFGFLAFSFGVCFGVVEWAKSGGEGIFASAGTVMFAGLPIILGFQLLLNFLAFDMGNIPRYPFQNRVISAISIYER